LSARWNVLRYSLVRRAAHIAVVLRAVPADDDPSAEVAIRLFLLAIWSVPR
jgi:hypothetical protein